MPVPAGSGGSPIPGGPLVYDPVLSRVRLSLSGFAVTAQFGTPVTAGSKIGRGSAQSVPLNVRPLPSRSIATQNVAEAQSMSVKPPVKSVASASISSGRLQVVRS